MSRILIYLQIIGIVHSKYKTISEAPRQYANTISIIEIYAKYSKGLKDIEAFSHFHTFYWLHESKGYNLLVHTPWDETSHGLFATRSPQRPNPIGYSVVKLVKKEENKLYVKGLDAIHGTPVIDIKPYIKKLDIKTNANTGWIQKTGLASD